jgi:RND family efflux transporter MFP subunit
MNNKGAVMGKLVGIMALLLGTAAFGQTAPQSMISSQARSAADAPIAEIEPQPAPMAENADSAGLITCLLAPARVADIASASSGLVENVAFKRSDFVQKGDLLVQLDDRIAASDVELARIAMTALGAKLERAQKLEETRIISRDEIEALRADYATTKAQLARAQVQLDMTRITAPFAGIISNVLVETGEIVTNTEVMQLIDISTLRVEMSFGRGAFGTLKVGDQLNIAVDLVSKVVPATVIGVDPFLDASSNTFYVIANVENADLALPAGANCTLAP